MRIKIPMIRAICFLSSTVVGMVIGQRIVRAVEEHDYRSNEPHNGQILVIPGNGEESYVCNSSLFADRVVPVHRN